MVSFGQRLEAANWRPVGFDYMRLAMSTMVLVWHSIVTSYGPAAQSHAGSGGSRALAALTMPMFFALSGFAVSGSLYRSRSLFGFMGLRMLRIYPALFVAVLGAGLIVGPLLTERTLGGYFGDPMTWRYLVGVTGVVAYELPGLFLDNPNPVRVNGQLWTVPFDLFCYSLIAGFAALGLVRRRGMFLTVALAIWMGLGLLYAARHGIAPSRRYMNAPGSFLVAYFLAGTALFLFRDRVPWSRALAALSAAATLVLLSFPVWGDLLAVPAVAYLTMFLGLCDPSRHPVLKGTDYSYGVFIYGYLVQQSWMTAGPWAHHWWINLALTMPTVWLIAALSWHYVEKPALAKRTLLFALEERWIRWTRRLSGAAARLRRPSAA